MQQAFDFNDCASTSEKNEEKTVKTLFTENAAPISRSYKGYLQHKVDGVWNFCVTGFDETLSGESGFCSVLLFDGREKVIPIDENNRIRIGKTSYGHESWKH